MKQWFKIALLLGLANFSFAWAAESIPGSEGGLAGLSMQWVTTPLKEVKLDNGSASSQVFIRYIRGGFNFQTGSIVYYSFPKEKDHDKKGLDKIAEAFKKAHKLKSVLVYQYKKDVWVISAPAENLTKGLYFGKIYYFRGKDTYALASSLLRRPYVDDAYAEAEMLQIELMERARMQDQKKTFSHQWQPSEWYRHLVIEEAYAQGVVPPNCPPMPTAGTTSSTGCPSAATCAGMLPPAQEACLANINSCNTAALNGSVNSLNTTATGAGNLINCQSSIWGTRIDNIQGWLDGKQQWVDDDVLPIAQEFNTNFANAIKLAERMSSPGYLAAVAAAGATAAALATAGTNLLIEGISSGMSELFRVLSGEAEEERRRSEADVFNEAKEKYESLEKDLEKLEEALANSVDLMTNMQNLGRSFETLAADTRRRIGELRRDERRTQLQLERYIEDDSEQGRRCYAYYDEQNAALGEQKQSLENILKALNHASTKYGNFRNMCEAITRDMDRILAQEHVMDQLRKKLSSYYVSHLWVEQQDRVDRIRRDLTRSTPRAQLEDTLEQNEESFFHTISQPRIEPNSGDRVDCRRAISKAANYCYDSKTAWYENVPIIGAIANLVGNAAEGRSSDLARCAVGPAGNLAAPSSSVPKPRAHHLSHLTRFISPRLRTSEFIDEDFSVAERLCLADFVRAYNSFERKNQIARNSYTIARDTYNYRQTNIIAEEAYFNDLHEMINTLNVESACATIDNSECIAGDTTCERLKEQECVGNMLMATCAQLSENSSYCDGHVRGSCRGSNADDSDYCRYQQEAKSQCQSLYRSCGEQNYPVGCEEKLLASCNQDCLSFKSQCAAVTRAIAQTQRARRAVSQRQLQTKTRACNQFRTCERNKRTCRENKLKCMQSSFSKIKHRFGRIMSMRNYLKDGVCLPSATRQ